MPEPKKLNKPVDWDDLYEGRFMKGGQIAEGQKVVLTIAEVDKELLMADDDTEKPKGVMSFRETPLKLPVNKTNGLCLKAMFGRDVSKWPGKRVVLYRGDWKGQPAVRIYGSPDITENITIDIKLPKRRAVKHTLFAPKNRPSGTTTPGAGTTPPGGGAPVSSAPSEAASTPARTPPRDGDGEPKPGQTY